MQDEPKADINQLGAACLTDEHKLSLQARGMGVTEEV
jgi:hypothetical protein